MIGIRIDFVDHVLVSGTINHLIVEQICLCVYTLFFFSLPILKNIALYIIGYVNVFKNWLRAIF